MSPERGARKGAFPSSFSVFQRRNKVSFSSLVSEDVLHYKNITEKNKVQEKCRRIISAALMLYESVVKTSLTAFGVFPVKSRFMGVGLVRMWGVGPPSGTGSLSPSLYMALNKYPSCRVLASTVCIMRASEVSLLERPINCCTMVPAFAAGGRSRRWDTVAYSGSMR